MNKSFIDENKMLFLFLVVIYAGCGATDQLQDEHDTGEVHPERVPYTLFHDFETGELFGWEPYPYQQDVGYDALFFTRQSPTYNDSDYAIARPVNANDMVELYQGFTRRLNMWTRDDTRFKAAVFFQSDRKPEKLELSLGTFDGQRYKHTIMNPDANRWVELDIPIEAFRKENGRSLTAGEHIQVVTLKASYPVVYYLFTYTMLMDDFQINGERQRRFVANNPESIDFEKFHVSILDKHYYYGDTISLSVAPEGNLPLQRVAGTLVDSRGQVVRDGIEFTLRDGEWVNDSIHRVTEGDERGRWEIRLAGQTGRGSEVRWDFEFLVPGGQVVQHPRLFFTADELAERLENENSPVAQRILENALENTGFMDVNIDAIEEGEDRTAEALTGGPYSGWRENFGDWSNPMSQLGNVIREGSFRYAFTGDRAAGEKAKEALLKLCSFEKWNNYWMLNNQFWTYYPVGYTLKPVAYAYDMINDLLSEEEKQFVRDAIMEKGLKMFHRDMVEMNRMPSNNTNHIAVLVSGHGLAATAIYGEDPDNPYLEPYLSGIMTKARTFIDRTYYEDGSYGEPYSYQAMASRSLSEIMNTFERNFGVDWTTTTDVKNFYKYPLQVTHSSGMGHRGFGDGGVSLGSLAQVHGQWIVQRLGNPYIYNYVKPYWEEGNGGYMGYLYFRDDIEPVLRETLPASKVFDDALGMVMRSGWEDESTIITTRVGPHSNHLHFDQGTFLIMKNGEHLLYDAAHGGAYYENLEFPVYNIQAISKNVMLIDNDAESQKPAHYDLGVKALQDWPRMVHTFAGEVTSSVESDLATVYKEKLDSYNRTLLFTNRGALFLFDEVRSVSTDGHMYNWLFHAEDNEDGQPSIRYDDHRVTIDKPAARMTIDVVSPQLESGSIRQTRFNESFVTLNSHPGLNETAFLAVLVPEAKPEGSNYGPRPVTQQIDAPGWIGASVERTGEVDYGFFRTGQTAAGTVEGFTIDARRFTATLDDAGTLLQAYFEGSSFEGHGLSVSSDDAVTVAIAPANGAQGSATRIEVKADQSTRLTVSSEQRPSQVLLSGEATGNWSYDSGAGQLTIQVPAGRHDFTVH